MVIANVVHAYAIILILNLSIYLSILYLIEALQRLINYHSANDLNFKNYIQECII